MKILSDFNAVIGPFVQICDVVSDSVDMIQAGGGNASAKYDSHEAQCMLIKASGFLMSEVDDVKGYAKIDLNKIIAILEAVEAGEISIEDETKINSLVSEANMGTLRPSIETFLHAMLPQRFVLHVHALTTLVYASSKRFVQDLERQWQGGNPFEGVLLVRYEKPGIHLAMAMKEGIEKYKSVHNQSPEVIILQNHGLIVSGDSAEALLDKIISIEVKIKQLMGLSDAFDSAYREQSKLKSALRKVFPSKKLCVRLNEDRDLVNYVDGRPSFPDALVFCGFEPLHYVTEDEQGLETLLEGYKDKYDDFPKVILVGSHVYFCGETIKKCLEVQDVLKIQWILRRELGDDLTTLSDEQAYTLLNWEAEKYRKNL